MTPDLVTLSWCLGEIREALAQADRLLERQLQSDADDFSSVRAARAALHQANGALQVVAIDGAPLIVREAEALLDQVERGELAFGAEPASRVSRASTALIEHLESLLRGERNQPLFLYPYYRDLRQARGADRAHPADLFFPDLEIATPPAPGAVAGVTDAALAAARAGFERGLLLTMRDAAATHGPQAMHEAVATVASSPLAASHRRFWWVTQAYFGAVERGEIPIDVEVKRLLARFNLQLRKVVQERAPVAERLVRDMLYALACAVALTGAASEVRSAFALDDALPEDFETPRYGRLDARVLREAQEALARAGTAFDRMTRFGADPGDLSPALDAFRDATARMPVEGLRALGEVMAHVPRATDLHENALREHAALEMATAILFAEQALEHGARPGSDYDRHGTAMADRLRASLADDAPSGGEVPAWLRSLSQQAQERLTMGAFVVETVTNLRAVEKQLDAFFRDPSERAGLPGCAVSLKQVAGVLRLLGHDDASRGADAVAVHVESLASDASLDDAQLCDRIAASIGAIGFFVEGLEHPERASGRFAFDELSGDFTADLGAARGGASFGAAAPGAAKRAVGASSEPGSSFELGDDERVARAAALYDALSGAPGDPALRAQLRALALGLRDAATLADDVRRRQGAQDTIAALESQEIDVALLGDALRAAGVALDSSEPAAALPADETAVDGELLEVFLEEAGEVLAAIADHVQGSRAHPRDQQHLTTIRRGFHTLKGSSRMVGLERFGEAGWAMEQVLNLWLSDELAGDEVLFGLIESAQQRMTVWVAQLSSDPGAGVRIDPTPIVDAANSLRGVAPVAAAIAFVTGEAIDPARDASKQVDAEAPLDAPEQELPDEAREDSFAAAPEVALEAAPEVAVEATQEEAVEAAHEDAVDAAHEDAVDAAHEDAPEVAHEAPVEAAQQEALAGAPDPATIEIGELQLSRPLYMVFLGEADDLIRTLDADARAWRLQPSRGATEKGLRAAHSLAGSASLLQLACVYEPARCVETFMTAQRASGQVPEPSELEVLVYGLERVQAMLHQFAAGTMPQAEREAHAALAALAARWSVRAPWVAPEAGAHPAHAVDPESAIVLPADEFDADLLPIFIEEATDSMPQVGANLSGWLADPNGASLPATLMRQLHTIKGSARMAGAMALGQLVHEIETRVETLAGLPNVPVSLIEELVADHDRVAAMFDAIRRMPADAIAPVVDPVSAQAGTEQAGAVKAGAAQTDAAPADPTTGSAHSPTPASPRKVARAKVAPAPQSPAEPVQQQPAPAARAQTMVRVRADLLDKLVNEAGEVSIARSRVDNQLGGLRQSLADLTENVSRLRAQLREIEIQAELQIQAKIAQSREHDRAFDPLEFDRYTRFQELTRMLAESVDDVATVQNNATRGLDEASQDLHRQGQVLRDLQQNLMRVRMVQFGSISDRLYRVVRQAAKELDKRVHLDIRGSAVELDRGVLETMAGPIEHLLRNAVAHGVEARAARVACGKSETGELVIEVRQEGREIVLEFSDDGGGLDFERIRSRALAAELIAPQARLSERELGDLIFVPGFTTVSEVTEIAGRGVGLDVVRAEVASLGGRVDIDSRRGEGTRFTISLPLTLAIAQVVLVSAGKRRYAVPSSSVEQVLQLKPQSLATAYNDGAVDWQGARVPLFYLGTLVEFEGLSPVAQHYSPVLIVRAGGQRIALHCDDVTRNQEIVVKNVGPQVARVRGVTGATVLGSGEIVLIVNPVALAQVVAGEVLDRSAMGQPLAAVEVAALPAVVMVVDDSLTVRKVTQRLLVREGYQVLLAKDGVDALRQLQETVPDVMLVDIEMPRMDGFDLTRNLRADPRFSDIPIVMITSRTADKHRKYAASLGVNVYLGKPYVEVELLAHIEQFTAARQHALA